MLALVKELPHSRVSVERKDKRDWSDVPEINQSRVHIYCDYAYAKQQILQLESFVVVDDVNEADFILTHTHFFNFYDVPQYLRVNQFPYEGGFVRKVSIVCSWL